jgi:hypothetical protein
LGVEKAADFIERAGKNRGIENSIQLTVAVSDGKSIWAFRFVSSGKARTLYMSVKPERLRALHLGNRIFINCLMKRA